MKDDVTMAHILYKTHTIIRSDIFIIFYIFERTLNIVISLFAINVYFFEMSYNVITHEKKAKIRTRYSIRDINNKKCLSPRLNQNNINIINFIYFYLNKNNRFFNENYILF